MNTVKHAATIILVVGVLLAGCARSQVITSPSPPAAPAGGRISWEEEWEKTLALARQEGKVVIYGEIGPVMRTKMPSAFKDKFGIEMEILTGSASQVAQRYLSEANVGIYLADVLFSGAGTFFSALKPRDVIVPLEPFFILPDTRNPALWPEGGIPFADKGRSVVMTTMGRVPRNLINTDLVKEGEITSFQDVLNPKWKSKIVIFDPTMTGAGSMWVALLLTRVYGLEEGKKYLQRIASLDPAFTRDKRLPVEWVAKGKYAIHIGPNAQTVAEFKQAGAPIDAVREREGSLLTPSSSCFGIVARPAHPNAAKVLVNWLLSAEAGAILSESFGFPSTRRDVPVAGLDPLGLTLPNEKVFFQDEEITIFQVGAGISIAKEIFGPLLK